MPEMIKHESGAILFYLTPEEQKAEDVAKEAAELKERVEKLEALLLKATEQKEEAKPRARRQKAKPE